MCLILIYSSIFVGQAACGNNEHLAHLGAHASSISLKHGSKPWNDHTPDHRVGSQPSTGDHA